MGDVATLNEMVTSSAVAISGDLFTLVAIMFVLLLLNWQLALISFAAFPGAVCHLAVPARRAAGVVSGHPHAALADQRLRRRERDRHERHPAVHP